MPPRKRTPASESASALEAVTRLLTERQKYEQWLRELDEKKDSTPEKVFVRVKEDYSTRLQEVVGALREHTSTMQEHARNLMVRLKELEVSEEELLEEQSENELRAKVGELSQSEFETSTKKAQRMLAKFKEDQELIADDLTRIRDLVSGNSGDQAAVAAAEPPRHSTDFDELEFLKSVVGPTTPVAPSAPRVSAAKPAVPQPAPPSAGSAPAAPPAPPKAPEAPKPEAPKPEASKAPVAKSGTPASTSRVTSETPSALHSQIDQPKTLKCAECGAMNYPSEWYCERCGAELTVV
jgi:hypothetical protein